MKCRILAALIVLALSPLLSAQDCSALVNWDLRGTYSLAGNGWKDLSKEIPGLPPGSVPVSYVGVLTLNGAGFATRRTAVTLEEYARLRAAARDKRQLAGSHASESRSPPQVPKRLPVEPRS